MARISDSSQVFINCPFKGNEEFLRATVFTIFDCGFIPRCAKEVEDSGEVRISKIIKIIRECRYGIHDISFTELDPVSQLPRFNMPFELGLFLGAKEFGDENEKKKICLVLDREHFRYPSFLSDIAGQDIQSHGRNEEELIRVIRNWLNSVSRRESIPGPKEIIRRYSRFKEALPIMCSKSRLELDEITYSDHLRFASEWLKVNAG